MFYPHSVTLFTEVCMVKQQIDENVIEGFFFLPQISTLEVFVRALKPAIVLEQYYVCFREENGRGESHLIIKI